MTKLTIDENGNLHRTDGPAVEDENGYQAWYLNGKQHRVGGPAVVYANGTRAWFIHGKRHRTDGPAIEYDNGICEWWVDGKRHSKWGRTLGVDGPAVAKELREKDNEIEQLRLANLDLQMWFDYARTECDKLQAEVLKLREELNELRLSYEIVVDALKEKE